MDEFSPGGRSLHCEKSSNVSKNSSKKYQLRADVKRKIKQRLHRDKPKENCTNNHTGITLPTANTEEQNLSKCNTIATINKGSYIAKVAEKLWSMKRNPHLYNEKFVYAGRVPCFLKRNIKKVDKENRTRCTRSIRRKKVNKSLCSWQSMRPKKQKATKEFYFRFIKHKNTKRPASGRTDNDRAKRLCLEPEDSEGTAGGRIGKGPAKTAKRLANGKMDNERLCRNPQEQTVEKTDKHNRDNDFPNSFSIQKDSNSDSVFECDSNTGEVSPQAEETVTDAFYDQQEPCPKSYVLKTGSYMIQSNRSMTRSSVKVFKRTINQECLNSEFKESQRICKPTLSELSNKEKEFFPKSSVSRNGSYVESNHTKTRSSFKVFEGTSNEHFNSEVNKSICKPTLIGTVNTQKRWFPKNCESKNGSYGESSRPKTRLSFKVGEGTINQENLEFNESQSIFKATSNREDNSEASKRTLVGKYSNENSRQVRPPTSNKEKYTKALRVSLMDCFANGLHARQNLSQVSFQTTSTPKAIRVPTKFQEVPTSHITPRVPTSHMRVPTSHITPKVPTSVITPRVPTSHITPRVPKSHITPRVPISNITPPESEVSCTEDERSVFTQEEEFERDKFRGSSKENNKSKRTAEEIIYKPLFSNKPRLWKSVVVENDS